MTKLRDAMCQVLSDHTKAGGAADDCIYEAIYAVVGMSGLIRDQEGWTPQDRVFLDKVIMNLCRINHAIDQFRKQKRAGRN